MEIEAIKTKPLTIVTYAVAALSLGIVEFILLAMNASCAFSDAFTTAYCSLSETQKSILMVALAISFLAIVWLLRKKMYWRTALTVSAVPLIALALLIPYRLLTL